MKSLKQILIKKNIVIALVSIFFLVLGGYGVYKCNKAYNNKTATITKNKDGWQPISKKELQKKKLEVINRVRKRDKIILQEELHKVENNTKSKEVKLLEKEPICINKKEIKHLKTGKRFKDYKAYKKWINKKKNKKKYKDDYKKVTSTYIIGYKSNYSNGITKIEYVPEPIYARKREINMSEYIRDVL